LKALCVDSLFDFFLYFCYPKFLPVRLSKILVFLILFPVTASAQIGGSGTYSFLNLPGSARIAAIGSNFISVNDKDLTLAFANPSFIDKDLHHNLAFSFTDYLSDVNFGFASYSHTFNKVGSFAGTLQFITYGRFTRADENGNTLGNFNASEYALTLGWGRHLSEHFSVGANLKLIYSDMAEFNSFGLAVDVAGSYFNKKRTIALTLLGKNIGRQLDAYIPGHIDPLPFEMQLGFSSQFGKLPMRIHIIATHLEKWDLTYEDPANPTPVVDPLTGDSLPAKKFEKWLDKLGRHFVIGLEFSPVKAFTLRFGYNYERRKELHIDAKKGLVGFSYGIGFRVSKFNFSYTRSHYSLGGVPNYITITTNISDFLKKKGSSGSGS
jgi:hypothetical protein